MSRLVNLSFKLNYCHPSLSFLCLLSDKYFRPREFSKKKSPEFSTQQTYKTFVPPIENQRSRPRPHLMRQNQRAKMDNGPRLKQTHRFPPHVAPMQSLSTCQFTDLTLHPPFRSRTSPNLLLHLSKSKAKPSVRALALLQWLSLTT